MKIEHCALESLLPSKYRRRAKDLTPARTQVLSKLVSYTDLHDYPPSVRELASLLNLRSPSTVHAHLECLERQGLAERAPGVCRGWQATRTGRGMAELQRRAA